LRGGDRGRKGRERGRKGGTDLRNLGRKEGYKVGNEGKDM
jgi:hypothetical protein